ncbi:mannonate dehydratase [Paenibacillus sp. KQZ6P-2]|uniref:mannonate dehydratase n=1 Tax=Paenibacillus mangrovi TaxID=2931978 RepID=A0A9X2B3G8_9BACL|nr:mannonate dehydratase [Paenibacillus mangrovi]MCJ8013604.1 mannonate dehydratase [Paenibacillus mangrovi]
MKLGIGLYRHMLTRENYRFAKQAGCTHIIAHLVDYFPTMSKDGIPATDATNNWGITSGNMEDWSYESLRKLKDEINEEGLELYAIENFDPAHWHDVLLNGPRRDEQIELLKSIIRNVGKAGIPVMGYNFSLAGVWGHTKGEFARGGAVSVGFTPSNANDQTPIPQGEVWNMTYDPQAPEGTMPQISEGELWERYTYFLKELVPVAEETGVRLAAHPDDPPMPQLRGTPRLVYQPHLFQKMLDSVPSHANALDFCMGTVQEMSEGNLYETIDQLTKQNKICYVHFRNVIGKVPEYREVFVDEGDIDMIKALRIYKKNNFDGVFIPDHTPQISCNAPWHAGMAYALGYMKAALSIVNNE